MGGTRFIIFKGCCQFTLYLIRQHRANQHFTIRSDEVNRRNPTHAVSFGYLRLVHPFQFAHLRVWNARFGDVVRPFLFVCVKGNPEKLHAIIVELVVEPDDFGKILATVGTPRSPKIDDDVFPFRKLTEFHRFTVRCLKLEIGSGSSRLEQLLRVGYVKIGDHLRLYTNKRHEKHPQKGQFELYFHCYEVLVVFLLLFHQLSAGGGDILPLALTDVDHHVATLQHGNETLPTHRIRLMEE